MGIDPLGEHNQENWFPRAANPPSNYLEQSIGLGHFRGNSLCARRSEARFKIDVTRLMLWFWVKWTYFNDDWHNGSTRILISSVFCLPIKLLLKWKATLKYFLCVLSKETHYANFRAHNFGWQFGLLGWHALMLKTTPVFSYCPALQLCIPPLSETLFKLLSL